MERGGHSLRRQSASFVLPPPPFSQGLGGGGGGGGGKGWGKGGRNGVKGKSPRAAVPVYFEWSHLSIDGRNQTVEKNYLKKKRKKEK